MRHFLKSSFSEELQEDKHFKSRAFKCLVFGAAISVSFYYLNCRYVYTNLDTLFFYLFSSIIQGFMGLVAFLGAVVIFQLQATDRNYEKTLDEDESKNFFEDSRSIRRKMMIFTLITLFEVLIAIVSLLVVPLATRHLVIGSTLLFVNLSFVSFILISATLLVKKTVHWSN